MSATRVHVDTPPRVRVPAQRKASETGSVAGQSVASSATAVPRTRQLWVVFGSVTAAALLVLLAVWRLVDPVKDSLGFEVAKVSLQVLGVVVVGGIVTSATANWQYVRQVQERELEALRVAGEKRLELQREEFTLRAALLDRTSRSSQKMFVTCQHVRRVQSDHARGKVDDQSCERALRLLDETYLEFSAEAEALQTELASRFGVRKWGRGRPRGATRGVTVGEAHLRWHQISDLLTVYYFNLQKNFRKDVLQRNSRTSRALHSGLNFTALVADSSMPTDSELSRMRQEIRKAFADACPRLAKAVLNDELRTTS